MRITKAGFDADRQPGGFGGRDSLGGELVNRDIGTVSERERDARWHLAISPRLAVDLALGSLARTNHDTTGIGVTPDETYRSARLLWGHPDGETHLTAQQRNSFDTYHPLGIEHNQRIDDRLSVNFALGSELPATESTPLRVAGMKDAAALGLRYRLTARAHFRVLRVARTLADLESAPEIQESHIAEALRYRMLDAKYWGG